MWQKFLTGSDIVGTSFLENCRGHGVTFGCLLGGIGSIWGAVLTDSVTLSGPFSENLCVWVGRGRGRAEGAVDDHIV